MGITLKIDTKNKRDFFRVNLELIFLKADKKVSERHLEFLTECVLLVHSGFKHPLSTSNRKKIAERMGIKASNLYTIISNCRADNLIPRKGEELDKTLTGLANLRVDEIDYKIKLKLSK